MRKCCSKITVRGVIVSFVTFDRHLLLETEVTELLNDLFDGHSADVDLTVVCVLFFHLQGELEKILRISLLCIDSRLVWQVAYLWSDSVAVDRGDGLNLLHDHILLVVLAVLFPEPLLDSGVSLEGSAALGHANAQSLLSLDAVDGLADLVSVYVNGAVAKIQSFDIFLLDNGSLHLIFGLCKYSSRQKANCTE